MDIENLKQESQKIIDLTNILHHLIEDEQLRGNTVFCELMETFTRSVETHLVHEDRSVYSELLANKDRQLQKLADQFMTNTHELRRLMNDYTKHWCHTDNKDHSRFVDQTRKIISLVKLRIDLEDSQLFPAVAELEVSAG